MTSKPCPSLTRVGCIVYWVTGLGCVDVIAAFQYKCLRSDDMMREREEKRSSQFAKIEKKDQKPKARRTRLTHCRALVLLARKYTLAHK